MPEPLHKLVENYQYYRTPIVLQPRNDVRSAVAVDCEMGTAASGDSELIRLTLVDYFSDEILIDNIVLPDVPMQHLNTRYSGVTWADMRNAQKRGTGLDGKAGAREAFWKYVGPNTILVGHGVQNDLRSLRLIHTLVADSLVTESKRFKAKVAEEEARKAEMIAQGLITAEDLEEEKKSIEAGANAEDKVKKKKRGMMSLKMLAKKYLDRDIQVGKKGHDSLEDAVAARDVVHYNVLALGAP
jgi:RNA exonuclease 1